MAAAQPEGQLRSDVDVDLVIDLLYGLLYYRLLITRAPLTGDYVDQLVATVLESLLI